MADKINDGGPAFPQYIPEDACGSAYEGISARDYFAAAALTGMMAYGMTEKLDPDELAHDAYCTADAMLSARKKGGAVMERCPAHDLLNCKCAEPLSTFLVRQFAESVSDRVERSGTWVPRDGAGRGDRRGVGPDRGGLGSQSGGQG